MKRRIWIIAWLGSTLLAFGLDRTLCAYTAPNAIGFARDVLTSVDFMAGYPIHMLVVAMLASCKRRKRLIFAYGSTMIGQGLLSSLLKIAVGRGRPGLGEGAFYFRPFHPGSGLVSFPSGDACAAMAFATILGFYFPRSRWLFRTLGLAAGLARVAQGRHFLSDVIFGAGMGCTLAMASFHLFGEKWFRLRPGEEGLLRPNPIPREEAV